MEALLITNFPRMPLAAFFADFAIEFVERDEE